MSSLIPRPGLVPDLVRFLESGWPFLPFGDHQPVRIEDYQDNGNYVLRAELPGLNPEKDIHITVEGNELAINAERKVDKRDRTRSEFSYGSFARTVRLPGGGDAANVTASYHAGILEVRVPVKEQAAMRQIPVAVTE